MTELASTAQQADLTAQRSADAADGVAELLARTHPYIEVVASSPTTRPFLWDRSRVAHPDDAAHRVGPAVAYPTSAQQVQALVRFASEHRVSVVARGQGTGLSGGAAARPDQLVISLERLDRLLEVSPLDQVAVVEPGVINTALNEHLAQYGLTYAPDPASAAISSIGGKIATNAGGPHCAKYGVTGLDLVSLFVGSEGILGIVVGATLRLRHVPVARRTVTAFFDSTLAGAQALGAIATSPVEPAVVEFFDEPTLRNIDDHARAGLQSQGAALLLIELDGYGIDEQIRDLRGALEDAGGRFTVADDATATRLWELRRSGRGEHRPLWVIGEDIAVPKSRIPDVYAYFPELERRYGVEVSAVAHAADGNLHPQIKRYRDAGDDPVAFPDDIRRAADDLVRFALSLGGTVSGEHGIGTAKRTWLSWELDERTRRLEASIKHAVDPGGVLNPGKAI